MIIGIIGGGQLGMMMAEAAKEFNHKVIGLDPNIRCSLSYIADKMIVADYNDIESFNRLYKECDVITYEFENVDLELIDKYIDKIPQKSKGLLKSRDRFIEKTYATSLGIKTVGFRMYENELDGFYPSIIKTTTGGYDGKGQHRINCKEDIDHFIAKDDLNYIIEELIDFDYEISVIATRDEFGKVVTYPIPVNTHINGILSVSEVGMNIPSSIVKKATQYTVKLIKSLDYVGTMAIEYFVRGKEVIFNEFAPRPHNSGHYTIEGCAHSQYENHILAITHNKVYEPTLVSKSIMVNILGQHIFFKWPFPKSSSFVHMYHKTESRSNRKMGHITTVTDDENVIKSVKSYVQREFL